MPGAPAQRVHRIVLRWYAAHGRDLPWRRTRDPYAILVSELMLQQTQVSRVIPKYREFLRRFPTVRALAAARLRDVLAVWSGLGYNRRAKHLWEAAKAIVARGCGLPRAVDELRALPGIGRYTAGAVASFAFGAREAAVDTNVRRVLSRALRGVDRLADSQAWRCATAVLPRDAARWNHALMDIGALYCRATPNCASCPLRRACKYSRAGALRITARPRARPAARRAVQRYEGSRRQHRGRVIRALTGVPHMSLTRLGPQVKEGFGKSDLPWLRALLADLER
ncbi:MAG: A/G-specific adenine glycosylase, partial [Candidatus Eremiobacteraeota bacterium]|nr:A/G-specific adenine glycosylase [Candidatus Eremiobacteraeota bacterium]